MKNPSFRGFGMVGLLVGRHRRRGPTNKSPGRLADRGLVYELFQTLVGVVLPDYDHYDDASLLNSFASHATQLAHGCSYPGTVRVSVFVADRTFRAAQRYCRSAA